MVTKFGRTTLDLGWKFWASELIMIVMGVYNFTVSAQQWGYGSSDATVSQGGILSAGSLELGLIVFLHLARFAFFSSKRHWLWVMLWGIVSAGLAFISLHNNQLYFQAHWRPEDGDPTIELWVRCVIPMLIMFLCALVPPGKRHFRTQEEIDAEYNEKIYEAKRRNELAAIQRQVEQQQKAERDSRKEQEEVKHAVHLQMTRVAVQKYGQAWVNQFEVKTPDGEIDTDWLGMEDELRDGGDWPPSVAKLPTPEQLVSQTAAADAVQQESPADDSTEANALSDTGNHPRWVNAEQVAEIMECSLVVAQRMIAARSNHPYAVREGKNWKIGSGSKKDKMERKVPYSNALKVKAQLLKDREAKVLNFPKPKAQQEPQAKPPTEAQAEKQPEVQTQAQVNRYEELETVSE